MLAGKAFAVATSPTVAASRVRTRLTGAGVHGAVQLLSAADIVELENKAKENARSRIDLETFQDIIPLIACVLWIFVGTVFYAIHDKFGWALGLYMSVNVGWSIGWTTPKETDEYGGQGSKIFSAIHTSIGVIFVGIAVMYMARKMTENKDDWMAEILKKKQLTVAAATEGYMDDIVAVFTYYMPKYKVIALFLFFILFGFVFIWTAIDEIDCVDALDFVLSTLSGAGYVSLPLNANKWAYVVISLYTTTGVPVTAIAVGMILSFILVSEDNSVIEKIIAVVTDEELDFMKMFGIDDGDGTLDNREFIILTVVRIGAAPPSLISQINTRFQELDRRQQGKIMYEDIVYGMRKKNVQVRFKTILTKEKFQQINRMRSYKAADSGGNSVSGARVLPVDDFTFAGLCESKNDEANNHDIKCVSDDESSDSNGVRSIDDETLVCMEEGFVMPATFEHEVAKVGEMDPQYGADGTSDVEATPPFLSTPKTIAVVGEELMSKASPMVRDVAINGDVMILSESAADRRDVVEAFIDVGSEHDVAIDNQGASIGNEVASDASGVRNEERDLFDHQDVSSERRGETPKAFGMLNITAAVEALKLSAMAQESESLREGGDLLMQRCNSNASNSNKRARRMENMTGDSVTVIQRSDSSSISCKHRTLVALAAAWKRMRPYMADPYLQAFVAWVIWLLTGTLFFKFHTHVGWYKAIFQSVSIGYGIFWIPIDPGPFSHVYIRLHFVIGVAAIGGIMAVFARSLADSKARWYVDAMKQQALVAAGDTEGYLDDIVAYTKFYWPKIQVHVFFLAWLALGISASMAAIKWSFLDAVYFSLATMTTGGIYGLPDDIPSWFYLFTAIYVMFGVPLMAFSFGLLANAATSMAGSALLDEKINARITKEELSMMKSFGIENGDGSIDNKEYVILTLVRIGALAPELIRVINSRFQALDVENRGSIMYADLQSKSTRGDGAVSAHQAGDINPHHGLRVKTHKLEI